MSFDENHSWADLLKKHEAFLPEFFIVSAVHLTTGANKELSIVVKHADGVRCPRTWRWVDKLVEVEGFGSVSYLESLNYENRDVSDYNLNKLSIVCYFSRNIKLHRTKYQNKDILNISFDSR